MVWGRSPYSAHRFPSPVATAMGGRAVPQGWGGHGWGHPGPLWGHHPLRGPPGGDGPGGPVLKELKAKCCNNNKKNTEGKKKRALNHMRPNLPSGSSEFNNGGGKSPSKLSEKLK